ncbi:MAG TPA: glycosyltransferase [Solirubrobacteraceae bacterium]|nr:glycosyltransferase [Solirubrobacteraceae bacterium]
MGPQRSEPASPLVSFVVIAHNEAATIAKALESIVAQGAGCGREVIVVDDGSTDRTPEIVTALAPEHPDIRLIRLERNRGRGFARNVGVGAARGEYIATVDSDIVLPVGWLDRCLAALSDADAVGATAVPDGDVAYLYSRFGLTPKRVAHSTRITGSNAVYRREVFERVSFDRSLRDGEDVALNHALQRARARMVTLDQLTVAHEESKTAGEAIAWLYQSGRGAARQLRRYRAIRVPDVVFGGWVLSAVAATRFVRRGHRLGLALPPTYLAAAATSHVVRAFVWERRQAVRFLGAILTDMVLLTAYFSGRATGLVVSSRDDRRHSS